MFANMDPWDLALLAVAGYIAVVSLVKLMTLRRDKLVTQFRAEVEAERVWQAELARQQKRQAKKAAAKAVQTPGRGAA